MMAHRAQARAGSQSPAPQAIMVSGIRPQPETDVLNDSAPRNGARLLFARTFFRNPIMLGSVIPSSRFLIKGVLEPLDLQRARVIVEYGPGVGTITRDLLERMHPEAKLIVIEMNVEFVRFLRQAFRDERLVVVEGSAADVRSVLAKNGFSHADYVISGIPLGSMPVAIREHIVQETRAALAPGGAFMVYQFTSRVLPELQRVFEEVKHGREWLNVLPAHLFYCKPAQPARNGAAAHG